MPTLNLQSATITVQMPMVKQMESRKRRRKRVPGKNTKKKSGHCKYGGWSRAGMVRFNQLYNLVHCDRASPQSEIIERELLAFCRAQAGINDERHDEQQEGGIRGENAPEIIYAMPIEAAWDSDNKKVDKTAEVEQQIMVT